MMGQIEASMIRALSNMEGAMRLYQQAINGKRERLIPGQWHNSLIHPQTGEQWVWPEQDGHHADMAMALGLEPGLDRFQRSRLFV